MIHELYAVVSVDSQGEESIAAFANTGMQWVAVSSKREMMEEMLIKFKELPTDREFYVIKFFRVLEKEEQH